MYLAICDHWIDLNYSKSYVIKCLLSSQFFSQQLIRSGILLIVIIIILMLVLGCSRIDRSLSKQKIQFEASTLEYLSVQFSKLT